MPIAITTTMGKNIFFRNANTIPKKPIIIALLLNVRRSATTPTIIVVILKIENCPAKRDPAPREKLEITSGKIAAMYPPNTLGWGNVAYGRRSSRPYQSVRAIPGVSRVNVLSPNHHSGPPIECCKKNCAIAKIDE